MGRLEPSDDHARVLTSAQIRAVEVLTEASPQSLPSIGAEVGVSTAIASVLMEALERLGLAQRREARDDWRGGLVTLTTAAAQYRHLQGVSDSRHE